MLGELNSLIMLNQRRSSRVRQQISHQEELAQQIKQQIAALNQQICQIQQQIRHNKQLYREKIVTELVSIDFVKAHHFNNDKLEQQIIGIQQQIVTNNDKLTAVEQEILILKQDLKKLLVKEEKYSYLLDSDEVVIV